MKKILAIIVSITLSLSAFVASNTEGEPKDTSADTNKTESTLDTETNTSTESKEDTSINTEITSTESDTVTDAPTETDEDTSSNTEITSTESDTVTDEPTEIEEDTSINTEITSTESDTVTDAPTETDEDTSSNTEITSTESDTVTDAPTETDEDTSINTEITATETDTVTDAPTESDTNTENTQETILSEFTYTELDDGTISVSYKGKSEHVIVPEQIDGKTVTVISRSGFKSKKSIKTVTLPGTITTIDSYAFSDCSSLESINLPKSLSQIGFRAFKYCSSLKSVEISSDCLNKNSEDAFSASGLETVILGEGVTHIPSYCFAETKISKIELPSTVKTIDFQAFAATALETVILNEGLEIIEHQAFAVCLNLKEITIPTSVREITDMAFSGCSVLKKVIFLGNAPSTYKYSNSISGVWDPFNTDYTVYYTENAIGFTSPEWYGYPTEILK